MSEATTIEAPVAQPTKSKKVKAKGKKTTKKTASKADSKPRKNRINEFKDKILKFLKSSKLEGGEASSRQLVEGIGANPGPGEGQAVINVAKRLEADGLVKREEVEGKAGSFWKLTAKGRNA